MSAEMGRLQACALEASLGNMDGCCGFRAADAYVKMWTCPTASFSSSTCTHHCTTRDINDDNTPHWDHCCDLGFVSSDVHVVFEVWDDDTTSGDDLAGRYTVAAQTAANAPANTVYLTSQPLDEDDDYHIDVQLAFEVDALAHVTVCPEAAYSPSGWADLYVSTTVERFYSDYTSAICDTPSGSNSHHASWGSSA